MPGWRAAIGSTALVVALVAGGTQAMASRDGRPSPAARLTTPPARAGASMAPDRSGKLVLFGGWSNDRGTLSDTWTWDGTSWTEQHAATHPTARCCFGLAYDAAREETVLWGGFDGAPRGDSSYFGETWIWDGATWHQRHPEHSPGIGASFGMVYDAATEQVLAFMGEGLDANPWAWDGTDWTELTAATSPAWRELEAAAYDEARGQVVMFGGQNCGEWCYDLFNDTWTWDGTDWSLQQPTGHPRRMYSAGVAFDALRQQVVLFGGDIFNVGARRDTWVWDGNTWTRLRPSDSPSAREFPAMAWDAVRQQVVLFGGRDWPQDIERDFGDTWTWDGVTWNER
jgi:hypothetical protein